MTDSGSGAVSNATSVDGQQWNVLGGMRLAGSLEQMASSQTDPAVSQYLQKMATLSYYLGGAEGELDGVPGLELDDNYGNLDAYLDIEKYKGQLNALLSNPPAGMSQQTYREAMPLAADAYNIAQAYYQHLEPVVAKHPDQNFYLPQYENLDFGTGKVSEALTSPTSEFTYQPTFPPSGESFAQVMSLQELKTASTQMLKDNKVTSDPVVSTLTDATQLDQTSMSGSGTTVPPQMATTAAP
jgi:hypothetical protein